MSGADAFGYRVRPGEPGEVRAALARDWPQLAFARGYLDAGLAGDARYLVASEGGGRLSGVLAHVRGAEESFSVLAGDEGGAAALLARDPGPRSGFVETIPALSGVLGRFFSLGRPREQLRMVREGGGSPAAGAGRARPLEPRHAGAVNALYRAAGERMAVRRRALERRPYRGVWDGEVLVSVAGAHLVAPGAGLAVVGDVCTAPGARRRGLGASVVSAVGAALAERGCEELWLSVESGNAPAIALYERLGYVVRGRVVERSVRRRDALALRSTWRRLDGWGWRVRG